MFVTGNIGLVKYIQVAGHYSVNFKWVKYSAIKNCNLGEFEFAIALMKKVKRFPMCSMHCALPCATILLCIVVSWWWHTFHLGDTCYFSVALSSFFLCSLLFYLSCILSGCHAFFFFQIFHFLLLLCQRATPRDTQRVPPERRPFFSSPLGALSSPSN